MVKNVFLLGFLLFISSCAAPSSESFLSSESSTTTNSNISTEIQASSVTSTSVMVSSSMLPLNAKWRTAMGGSSVDLSQFYGTSENLTENLSSNKVVEVQRVLNLDGSLYGFVYEALVDGNGGRNSNRFRVGLANSLYLGFESVSEKEHANFGDIIINALKNSLKGTTAVYTNAWEIMIRANETVAAGTASETINPIADALESITAHYLSQI
ncbi:MAG: hypothetical protein ACO3C8_00370 [Bacilli bacterium]